MGRIIVFGGRGRAGRAVVAEAVDRGHLVTAVVRDPDRYDVRAIAGVRVVRGDVTDPNEVARLSADHDGAVSAVARLDVPAGRFYADVTSALVKGLGAPGPMRLVIVGIGTNLRTPDGHRAHDADGMPNDAREFSRGHYAGVRLLQDTAHDLDWVVLAPPPVFLDEENGGGPILVGDDTLPDPTATAGSFSYPEVATAVLDEIETPTRHRGLVSLARASASAAG
ncbi:NAD(P)-dependent oxidoreductase [Solicola gregarius]|uniref:NAD(P)H-binding protein n=1 Tax=Solicola gregarius TaxID=2908642 RepID=A0AA46TJZ4_9ACTN|nr:NAD(P)H-binding protein [Solicola gregarius]UYM06257.1 NAD(P)H-binding protein [Solicola gregarius]